MWYMPAGYCPEGRLHPKNKGNKMTKLESPGVSVTVSTGSYHPANELSAQWISTTGWSSNWKTDVETRIARLEEQVEMWKSAAITLAELHRDAERRLVKQQELLADAAVTYKCVRLPSITLNPPTNAQPAVTKTANILATPAVETVDTDMFIPTPPTTAESFQLFQQKLRTTLR